MVSSGRVPSFDLLLLGVAIVAISTSAPLIAGAAAPTLAIAFWRNALALPVLGAWVLGRAPERAAWRGRTRDEKRLPGHAGLLLGAHLAIWLPSLPFTSVASSAGPVAPPPMWAASAPT